MVSVIGIDTLQAIGVDVPYRSPLWIFVRYAVDSRFLVIGIEAG